MKVLNIIAGVTGLALLMTAASCEETPQLKMEQVQAYNDSIPKVITGISTIQTRTDKNTDVYDNTKAHLKLILGAPGLYDASPEQQQRAAITAGMIALHVFDSGIGTGTLIITKDLKEHKEDPADGKKIDMKIDSLKKVSQ